MEQEQKPFRAAVLAFECLQAVCHRLRIHPALVSSLQLAKEGHA